jgi:hypothetical protein
MERIALGGVGLDVVIDREAARVLRGTADEIVEGTV